MVKKSFVCGAGLLSIFALQGAVWAEDEPKVTGDANPAATTSSTPPTDTSAPKAVVSGAAPPAPAKKTPTNKECLAKRVLGFTVGAVVGAPVCVVRKSIDEEKYGIAGMIGNTDNKSAQVSAGAFWLPFAVFTGTVEAPVYSIMNSLKADEPFSKAQFSLSDVNSKAPANH
jgi:hypothetical protein